jgi:hypothetical protein
MEMAMESDDLTVRVLVEIRDEIRETNRRIDETNRRVDETNNGVDRLENRIETGLHDVRDELGRRIVESEMRTSTAIHDMHGTLRDIRDALVDRLDLRDRVARCEREIDALKHKVG